MDGWPLLALCTAGRLLGRSAKQVSRCDSTLPVSRQNPAGTPRHRATGVTAPSRNEQTSRVAARQEAWKRLSSASNRGTEGCRGFLLDRPVGFVAAWHEWMMCAGPGNFHTSMCLSAGLGSEVLADRRPHFPWTGGSRGCIWQPRRASHCSSVGRMASRADVGTH